MRKELEGGDAPVDHRDGLAVCAVSVGQEFVVNSDVLEALDDREGRAGKDGLDVTSRRLVVDRRRDFAAACCGEGGCECLGLQESNTAEERDQMSCAHDMPGSYEESECGRTYGISYSGT